VILTWKALADPTTGAFAVPGLEHIRDMQAVSDGEVVWTLDTYGGYLALGAALTPLPAARLGAVAHAQWRGSAFFAHPELASGPFAVGSAGPGVLSLVANPQYSLGGHPAYLDRALLRTYPSKGAMLRALQTGEADVSFHLDPSDVGQLKGLPGSQASSALGLRDEFLRPNPQAGPWAADTTLLAALAQALDRQALVTLAVGDEGRASRGLFPSALAGWNDPSLPAPASDPAAAVQRLEADGWKAGADGVRVKGGRRLAFTVIAYCASPVVSATLSRLSDEWGKVGAAVTTACRSHAELAQADAAGAFEMALESNRWAPDPDAWTALAGRCADPALAADFSAGASTVDSARRHSAYRTAEKEWLAVQCTIPLFEWPDVAAVSSRLRNFFPDPSSLDVWNAADWWLAAA
ncbi:MAG TPA: ABC transporter substrate-binding protein, partial [Candidatus Dormibacteraeota bacterium]